MADGQPHRRRQDDRFIESSRLLRSDSPRAIRWAIARAHRLGPGRRLGPERHVREAQQPLQQGRAARTRSSVSALPQGRKPEFVLGSVRSQAAWKLTWSPRAAGALGHRRSECSCCCINSDEDGEGWTVVQSIVPRGAGSWRRPAGSLRPRKTPTGGSTATLEPPPPKKQVVGVCCMCREADAMIPSSRPPDRSAAEMQRRFDQVRRGFKQPAGSSAESRAS
jgi:hypothetical protein